MKQWQGQYKIIYRKSLEKSFCCKCSHSSPDLILIFTMKFCYEWHSAAWGRIALVYVCTRCTLIIYIYIIESACLFAVNTKTMARIDAKRSGITKNDPESVLCGLKSPVLAFSERYCDISGFPSRSTTIFTDLPSTSGSCVDTLHRGLSQNGADRVPHRYWFIAK